MGDEAKAGVSGTSLPSAVRADDFPILGEPLIVELANSLYRSADGSIIDYLGSIDVAEAWFGHAPSAKGKLAAPLSASALLDLHEFRRVVVSVLDAVVDGQEVDAAAVASLNAFAARASARLELSWGAEERSAAFAYQGNRADVFIADLATESISFFAGPDLELVRRCERPGCFMLFVQQHRRRRFCYEGCSHRVRQARYYRSTTNDREKQR